MAEWYAPFEPYAIQSTVTCLAMAKASESKRILEVACGSGVHSEFIAKNYLQEGALLVSCDFSNSMVEMLKAQYDKSVFTKMPDCKFSCDLETDFVSNENAVAELPQPALKERQVFGCMADNMRLPFASESFDCYISNMSMMIVPDYKKQIHECFRVLKKGSFACFTVWGRPEETISMTVIGQAREALGGPKYETPGYFHITQNWDEVRKEFIKAGFHKSVKSWFQPNNWWFKDGKDFVERFYKSNPLHAPNVTEPMEKKVAELYDKMEGDQLRTFDSMVILVYKE